MLPYRGEPGHRLHLPHVYRHAYGIVRDNLVRHRMLVIPYTRYCAILLRYRQTNLPYGRNVVPHQEGPQHVWGDVAGHRARPGAEYQRPVILQVRPDGCMVGGVNLHAHQVSDVCRPRLHVYAHIAYGVGSGRDGLGRRGHTGPNMINFFVVRGRGVRRGAAPAYIVHHG